MIFCKLILEINRIYLFEWRREGFGQVKNFIMICLMIFLQQKPFRFYFSEKKIFHNDNNKRFMSIWLALRWPMVSCIVWGFEIFWLFWEKCVVLIRGGVWKSESRTRRAQSTKWPWKLDSLVWHHVAFRLDLQQMMGETMH